MEASEVKTFFEDLIDDTWDEDATYSLMQNANEELELERDWMILRTLDTTISRLTTDTWLTGKTLPEDFISPREVYVGTSAGCPLTQISMEKAIQYKDSSGYYYIDYSTMKIHFTGVANQTDTVYLYYKKTLGLIEADTAFLWIGKTANLLAYRMAETHKGAIDGDTINFEMTPEMRVQRKALYNSLIQWDTKLQLKSMGN